MLSLYQRLILGCLLLIALVTTVSLLVRTSFVRLAALDAQVHVAEAAVASLASAQGALAHEELIAARIATGSSSLSELHVQAAHTQILLRAAVDDVRSFDPNLPIEHLAQQHARLTQHPPAEPADLTRILEALHFELRADLDQLSTLRYTSVTALRGQQNALRARLIAACGLSILAATIISAIMLILVIRPLRHTARVARRIGQGDLHQRVEWRSKDDLGAIATELNRLAIRLRDLRETESGRRQMEFQLADAIVRSIFEPVIVTDGKGQVLKLNQAAVEVLGGSSQGAEVDRMVLTNTPGGDKILDAIRAAVSMQRATTASEGEAALLPMRIGKAERSYRLRTTPMRDSEGRLLGAVTLLEDVTEIAHVDRFKSRFLSVASQKLREPIRRLRLALYALTQNHAGELRPLQMELASSAAHEAENLDDLMLDLIEVAELETGRRQLRIDKVRPVDALRDAVVRCRDSAHDKNIDIELMAFEDVAYVQADRRALRTILDNLVTNALRYTPEGGHIRVGAAEQQDRVQFFVHDNGRGIEAERLPTIFGRFTGDPNSGSSGLGLALVRRLVESQGGEVLVESRLGAGTTFRFTLPIAVAEPDRHPVEVG
ncbi:MAG TPA: ATP-binding protein [Acidobacteriaceae bacterium]|jgi:signal transduction histidine kinase/HAMP domain-containing protein|nr:ATP-binding protein [Acidobacteriaceae bacterium]